VPADLRSAFPVLERVAYLNTGSVGPVPTAAMDAVREELDDSLENGRGGKAHFDRVIEMGDRLRAGVADLMGAGPGEVALTGATTDGVNAVVAGLALQRGDEVLTSDEEHPGLLAPLASARERRGIKVRVAPFAELAGAVGAKTRLVACSHVAWQTGRVMDTEALASAGAPVLLDGAQGLGAVPVDVGALGCDFYAASGQKWLCGPMGSGYLYVRSERIAELAPAAPGYQTLSNPLRALDLPLKKGAARFDGGFPGSHHLAWALASLKVLGNDGTVQAQAIEGARRLSRLLTDHGLTVAPRGDSTLVSWEASDPEAEAARLLGAGYLVRNLPGTAYVRASVGAWTSEEELAGLAQEAARSRS